MDRDTIPWREKILHAGIHDKPEMICPLSGYQAQFGGTFFEVSVIHPSAFMFCT